MSVSANIGDTIKIISLSSDNDNENTGKEGIVEYIDDLGILHGTWSSVGVLPKDEYVILDEPK